MAKAATWPATRLAPSWRITCGVPVVVMNAVPVGKFFVGAMDVAFQIFTRAATTITISESDGSNFKAGLIIVKAEAQLALASARPSSTRHGDLVVAGKANKKPRRCGASFLLPALFVALLLGGRAVVFPVCAVVMPTIFLLLTVADKIAFLCIASLLITTTEEVENTHHSLR